MSTHTSENVAKRKRNGNLEHARVVRSVRSFSGAPLRRDEPANLLAMAIDLIGAERASVVESYTDRIGPNLGKVVTDYDARRWIRAYDRFLKPARAYLKARDAR